ncbi:PH domain-containing protein [Luteimonas aquatica]|uniref:PH domain-containing protein n=1 Tax=Luteimonas aquatica TaxID=450364 RepID=UPI001F581BDA|nr:PH domain-containing protein [Luteimonas aquatica]
MPDALAQEHRLHPMSWLFVMLQHMRTFIVPLLAFLIFGRTDRNELWSVVAICLIAAAALWRYLTYSYRLSGDSVLIRSGLLHRTLRQIPFSRIHNVALHQTLLHRLFGVAEVRLESAGGHKPEAEMRVLKLAEASALETLIRRRGHQDASAATSAPAAPAPLDRLRPGSDGVLLTLPLGEVLRLGVISNRGMLVFGAAVVAVSQLRLKLPEDINRQWSRMVDYFFGHFGVSQVATVVVLLAVAFFALLRLLSVLLALLQYSGFRLEQEGRRLTVTRGLLTRLRTSAARRRMQAFQLQETVLHRLFGRRTLKVDTAVSGSHHDDRSFREIAPVATPETCDALVRHVLPGAAWPPARWRPLHPHAWLRLALPGTVLALLLTALLSWRYGALGLWGLAWLLPATFVAWQHARRAGYAVDDALVAVRSGWWSRRWRFAELDKLQVLLLHRSPLDRLLGMASLSLDTAGTDPTKSALRLRHLPVEDARALLVSLDREVARRPLRW